MLMDSLAFSAAGGARPNPVFRTTARCGRCRTTRMSMKVRTFRFSVPGEEEEGQDGEIHLEQEQRRALKKLLRNRRFQELVARDARCSFVRFTGFLFQRCEITEEYNQGLLPQHQKYQNDVNYSIVDLPPDFLDRAGIPPHTRRVSAVYERFGVPLEQMHIEQEIHTAAILEDEKSYERWADSGNMWRTEDGMGDFEQLSPLEENFYNYEID